MTGVGHGCIANAARWLQVGGRNLEAGAKSLGRPLEAGWWGDVVVMVQRGGSDLRSC
jgi:hypothetical protein